MVRSQAFGLVYFGISRVCRPAVPKVSSSENQRVLVRSETYLQKWLMLKGKCDELSAEAEIVKNRCLAQAGCGCTGSSC